MNEFDNSLYMWSISWMWETEEEILEDTEIYFAHDEYDALRQYDAADDIPEGARITDMRKETV